MFHCCMSDFWVISSGNWIKLNFTQSTQPEHKKVYALLTELELPHHINRDGQVARKKSKPGRKIFLECSLAFDRHSRPFSWRTILGINLLYLKRRWKGPKTRTAVLKKKFGKNSLISTYAYMMAIINIILHSCLYTQSLAIYTYCKEIGQVERKTVTS